MNLIATPFNKIIITGLFFILIQFVAVETNAQGNVGINDDGSTPNAGAILDLKSTDKGLLIPRMTSAQRLAISGGTPSKGMLVYDTNTQSFWYYNNAGWNNMTTMLSDADKDTKIQVEESADEDVIRFDVAGVEVMRHDGKTLHAEAPGESLFIGTDAGLNDDGIGDGLGNQNTFIGYSAGYTNNTAIQNTFLGTYAGTFNVIDSEILFWGEQPDIKRLREEIHSLGQCRVLTQPQAQII
ncbi:MAG: hypothetical protein R2788_00325 [Saprospiraceae bacterium]